MRSNGIDSQRVLLGNDGVTEASDAGDIDADLVPFEKRWFGGHADAREVRSE